MANGDYSAREVVELLAQILIEGRGGGPINPLDPVFGIGGSALSGKNSSSSRRTSASKLSRSTKVAVLKPKRTVSQYQKVFGKHLKALKKKHPKTKISVLMKKAHRLTKREMKK